MIVVRGGVPHGAGALLAGAAAHPGSLAMAGRWPLIAVLAGVFAALFVVTLVVIGSPRTEHRNRRLMSQIERYGPRIQATSAKAEGDGSGKVARTAISLTSQLLRSGRTEQGLAQRLDLAGITRTPAEWVLLGGCACVVLSAAMTILSDSILIGVAAGFLIGWLGMRLAVTVRIGRRQASFREQLPDILQLIASSLKAGFSLPQALMAVVREDSQPAAGEFSRALAEARVGVDMVTALDTVANRMDSGDLRWTAMAIRIQREVGGNLAEVLSATVGTMRDRASLHRHVRGLSAEGRLSAYILTARPIFIGGWMLFSDRSYVRPLYTTGMGLAMLGGAAVLFVLGVAWMRVLIKVEV